MRILVCGGRDFKDHLFVYSHLNRIAEDRSTYFDPNDNWLPSDIELISGCATGVDAAAIDWAIVNWLPKIHEFPANWKLYGKSAGYIRNQQMIDEGKPDLVVAFPGGRGTDDMVRRAKKAGIEVIQIIHEH